MRDDDGSSLGMLLELSYGGRPRGRLSTSLKSSEEEAIARLGLRAEEWIADYESRKHTGNTGFGNLE